MTDARPMITIDGVEYALPQDDLTMAEARILERYCDGNSAGDGYGIAKMCGTIHVAILRKRPGTGFSEIQATVDTLDLNKLYQQLEAAGAFGDAGPPDRKQSDDSEPSTPSSADVSELAQENGTPSSTGLQPSPTISEYSLGTSLS